MSVLDKYQLNFQPIPNTKMFVTSQVATPISYHLQGYFHGQSIEFLQDEVLPEMQKALSGQPFDEDAGGVLSFLTIGPLRSTFSDIDPTKPKATIPTQDIYDIITEWINWVTSNGFEKDII